MESPIKRVLVPSFRYVPSHSNAIDLAHDLGAKEVLVAILSAMETVNPDAPSTRKRRCERVFP